VTAGRGVTAGAAPADGLEVRPATEADLPDCERVWRDGLNDYLRRLNQLEIPPDNPGLRRLHEHTLATDPDRFLVAERDGRLVAFGSAVQRGPLWFLSMLFIDPAEQARGLGRRLLNDLRAPRGAAVAADAPGGAGRQEGGTAVLATATDSAQPISNGLYASLGIVPRMPLINVVGRPRDGWTPPALPAGIVAAPLGDAPATERDIDDLDRELLGFAHPGDHAFARRERPAVFGYRDAAGRLHGYGYTSPVGRIGPVAVRDVELMAPLRGHLLTTVQPRGASAVWLPGGAGSAVGLALEAGLRFEDFPLLLCWSRPFADFERYLPISPGLL
jgi:GNAT superfamily N-acetyltransferase